MRPASNIMYRMKMPADPEKGGTARFDSKENRVNIVVGFSKYDPKSEVMAHEFRHGYSYI